MSSHGAFFQALSFSNSCRCFWRDVIKKAEGKTAEGD